MAKLDRSGRLAVLAVAGLAFIVAQGCGRSAPARPVAAGSAGDGAEGLPFHAESGQVSSAGRTGSADSPGSQSNSGLPFKTAAQSRVLPSGTLLTVDLVTALSIAKVHVGDTFTAMVVAPLIVEGETIIPHGATVTGKVESAQAGPSGLVPGSGYFELILSTLTVDGRTVALQTSSLFARGNILHSRMISSAGSAGAHSDGVRVQKGRALTFRLTAPVTLDGRNPMAGSNSSGRAGE